MPVRTMDMDTITAAAAGIDEPPISPSKPPSADPPWEYGIALTFAGTSDLGNKPRALRPETCSVVVQTHGVHDPFRPPTPRNPTTMKVLHALLDSVSGESHVVTDVCVGAFQTAVTAGNTGLATTCTPQHSCVPWSEQGASNAGDLTGRDARELARMVLSDNPVEASIGMATVNALLPKKGIASREQDAADFLFELAPGKNVAVIGHFPFVDRLRLAARNLWVIEREPLPGDITEEQGRDVLPQSDVVCVTGSTLINHSFDDVMSRCRGAYVVLVGPSAPLTPLVFGFGVHAVCSGIVTDPAPVIRRVMQGATYRYVRRAGVRLVTMLAPTRGQGNP